MASEEKFKKKRKKSLVNTKTEAEDMGEEQELKALHDQPRKKHKKQKKRSGDEIDHSIETAINKQKNASENSQNRTDLENEHGADAADKPKKSKKKKQTSNSDGLTVDAVNMGCDGQENTKKRTLKKSDDNGEGTIIEAKKKKVDKLTSEDDAESGEQILSPEIIEMKRKKKEKMRKKKELKRQEKLAQSAAQAKAAEGGASGVPGTAEILSLQYLRLWATQRDAWNFQKVRQVWLLNHMYDCDKVPDKDFAILLEYLEGLKGKARETTVQQAENLVATYEKQLENGDDSSGDDNEDEEEDKKEAAEKENKSTKKVEVSESQYERVRQIIQLLS